MNVVLYLDPLCRPFVEDDRELLLEKDCGKNQAEKITIDFLLVRKVY